MTTIFVKDGITMPLGQLAQDFPKIYRQALMDLGKRYKRRMESEIKEGLPAHTAFPPLSEITQEVRRRASGAAVASLRKQIVRRKAAGMTAGFQNFKYKKLALTQKRIESQLDKSGLSGFGGKLTNLVEYYLPENNQGLRVGFLGVIKKDSTKSVQRFQTQETKAWTSSQKHWLHRMFGKRLPSQAYSRPARSSVPPYQPEMASEAYSIITKSMAARLKAMAARLKAMAAKI